MNIQTKKQPLISYVIGTMTYDMLKSGYIVLSSMSSTDAKHRAGEKMYERTLGQ